MTIYLERLKECYERHGHNTPTVHTKVQSYLSWDTGLLPHPVEVTKKGNTYYEEEHRGYQIVVVGHHYEWREIYDANGNQFPQNSYPEWKDIARRGEPEETSRYYAFAWEIGTEFDRHLTISWTTQFAVVHGLGKSKSFTATLKTGKKRVDLIAKLREIKSTLIEIAGERQYSGNNPYNASVNDQVFIQAHGRLRKGVIIDTTGSRFIVGYVTPSNHTHLKHKTLPLNHLYI